MIPGKEGNRQLSALKWTRDCIALRYWQRPRDRIEFTDGTSTLERHEDIRIVRHVKVQGDKSPGACPEPAKGQALSVAEGSHARFGNGGGVGDCPADRNWAA